METQTRISIIVPTYNRDRLAAKTVKYLSQLNYKSYEIIVVDQSTKTFGELEAIAGQNQSKIQYYKISKIGLPSARNFGISKANSDIILFCDDDIIPSQNLLAAHLNNYDNPQIGGVAGRIADKENIHKNGKIGIINRYTANQDDHFDATSKAFVDHGQGCNLSFRKSALEKIGGFDERFGGSAFLEETDVCLRIKEAGYQLIFEPKATVIHLKNKTGGCRSFSAVDWFYWYGHNYMLLFLKHFEKRYFPLFFVFRISNILKGFMQYKNLRIPANALKGIVQGRRTYKQVS